MPDSFYEPDGGSVAATTLTRGPWSEKAQHGGPPSALLARAVEAELPAEFRLARLTVDILRPVPISRVTPRATVRVGRRVARAETVLEADGSEIMTATAVAQRVAEVEVPPPNGAVMSPPEEAHTGPFFSVPWSEGYHTAVESRFVSGGWLEQGPAQVWLRQEVPLVAGEEPSPFQRAVLVADVANGVSATVDIRRFSFMNTDLTVHLHRDPVGEWIGLDAQTSAEPTGAGLATTLLYDRSGPVGHAAQSLLIAPH